MMHCKAAAEAGKVWPRHELINAPSCRALFYCSPWRSRRSIRLGRAAGWPVRCQ